MPYYDYRCEDCGPFTGFAPMSAYDKPCDCPECGATSERVLLNVPHMAMVSKSIRTAHETNERARHEPKSTKTHGPGCGCCSGGSKSKPSRTLHRPDGSKSFPSSRPWMISH